MSNEVIDGINRIKILYNEIENFQQEEIDEEKRERAFQFEKVSENLDVLLNIIKLHKKWIILLDKLNLEIPDKNKPMNDLKTYVTNLNLNESSTNELIKINTDLNTHLKEIQEEKEKVTTTIKGKMKNIQKNIIKAWNLIQEFSNIPEIKNEISKRYMEYLGTSPNEKEFLDCIKISEHVNELINLNNKKIDKFIKVNEFSNSIDNYLNFDEIGKKYDFKQYQLDDLIKIIKKKDGVTLSDLKIDSLIKIKEKLPEFYNRLFLKFK